tara:strand:+ start:552 stop:1049 length:498 start_codon:yes stop_codon:yes gene_type:complete
MSYTTITGKPATYINNGITEKVFTLHTNGSISNADIKKGGYDKCYYKVDGGYVHLPTFAAEAKDTLLDVFGEVAPLEEAEVEEVDHGEADHEEVDLEELEEEGGMISINSKVLKKEFLRYLKEPPIGDVVKHFTKKYKLTEDQKKNMRCRWIPYTQTVVKIEATV